MKVLVVANFNLSLGIVGGHMYAPFRVKSPHDMFYVPSRLAFYGYMLVAIITHDFLFYHLHRYKLANNYEMSQMWRLSLWIMLF